jgi:hypothetical protein
LFFLIFSPPVDLSIATWGPKRDIIITLLLANYTIFILSLWNYLRSRNNFLKFFLWYLFLYIHRFLNNFNNKWLILLWRSIINLFLNIVIKSIYLFYVILYFWLFCIYYLIIQFCSFSWNVPFNRFFAQIFSHFYFFLFLFFRRLFFGEIVLFVEVWISPPRSGVVRICFSHFTRSQFSWR